MGNGCMIWFTSDTHFGHVKILKYQPCRTFETVTEMDDHIIDSFNTVLRPGDDLWHLGDFCWGASLAGQYRSRIRHGVKLHLVQGNHDANSIAQYCTSFHQCVLKKFGGTKVTMCHFALWNWAGKFDGGYHFYGHSHGTAEAELNRVAPCRKSVDVGVDHARELVGDFRPLELEEVLEIIENRCFY